MRMEKNVGTIITVLLMSASIISACGKVTLPLLLVLDPAANNTMSITLPASSGGGTVTSKLVGNVNTSVVVDTNKLISSQGAAAAVKVNSFATAGTSINIGNNASGTLCTSIPAGEQAGGIAYLRPISYKDATFQLTIPTETKSMDPNVAKLLPPIPLTLTIDAKVKLDLTGLLNIMLRGTGLNIHQVLKLTIPDKIPLLGGSAVVLDTTLKSTKTPVTDPKLDECAGASVVKCGDGKVGTGETCDTTIAAGQTGACPTSCTPPDACHTSALQNAGTCTAKCVDTAITPCCGDGKVGTGEACDTTIAAGQTGACPTSCTAPDACHTSALQNAGTCTAKCVDTAITPCCGNGILEGTETCDPKITSGTGVCPTSCTAPDKCTKSTLTGSAAACTAKCVNEAIVPCCGNGVVETGETCDTTIAAGQTGACPTSCTPPDACHTSVLQNAGTCMAKCVDTAITPCCGDGLVDFPETCDGNCPTSCDDGVACTKDTLTGSLDLCNVNCEHTAITACVSGDGCCPTGCNHDNDTDCACNCGNGMVETTCNETCDPPNGITCDNTCQSIICVDMTGTWITHVKVNGTITAPSPVGDQTNSNIDVIQRLVVTREGATIKYRFDICSLNAGTNPGASIPFSTTYTPALIAALTTTGEGPDKCYNVNDAVALPTFVINVGWDGPALLPSPLPTCPNLPATISNWACPPAAPTTPLACDGAIDSDGDGYYGVTLPTIVANVIKVCAAAGMTITTSLSDMVLTNETTNTGKTNFSTVGYVYGTDSGIGTGNIKVTPPANVDVTSIKLPGDVPCSEVIKHCATVPCTATIPTL